MVFFGTFYPNVRMVSFGVLVCLFVCFNIRVKIMKKKKIRFWDINKGENYEKVGVLIE